MKTLTITKVVLTPAPPVNTQVTVSYSLGSNPTAWIVIANVSVPPSGDLLAALTVSTIDDTETSVNVRAVSNCGGTPYVETFN